MMILSGMHKFGALPTGPQFTHLCLASLCKPLYICVLLQSTVLDSFILVKLSNIKNVKL